MLRVTLVLYTLISHRGGRPGLSGGRPWLVSRRDCCPELQFRESQTESLASLAHALKGSSATLVATNMVRMCAELETIGQSQQLGSAPDLVTRLESEFVRVRSILNTQL